MCYIIYFIVCEVIKIWRQGCEYWSSYWVFAEWGVIATVICTRFCSTIDILKKNPLSFIRPSLLSDSTRTATFSRWKYSTSLWRRKGTDISSCSKLLYYHAFKVLIISKDLQQSMKSINHRYVGVIDEFYGYAIGFILFLGTIKLIQMLRFNNRFSILILTLKVSFKHILLKD